jgi:hypothetical protein
MGSSIKKLAYLDAECETLLGDCGVKNLKSSFKYEESRYERLDAG